MNPWLERSMEERNLFNPGFCSMLLWHAAYGYRLERSVSMTFEISFLVLPFILHKSTRESLPGTIRTSLPIWLAAHPIVGARLGERAAAMAAFTKESLMFGGIHDLLSIEPTGVVANAAMKKGVSVALRAASDEVRVCAKRAEFLGRWLESAGESETVMALLGVRP